MQADLQKAKTILAAGEYSCVVCKGETLHTATGLGVKPLIAFLNSGTDLRGFSAADKIVGKAAALLYVLLGVRAVYAQVLSRAGQETLEKHGIEVSCGEIVPEIRNRADTGLCPLEESVQNISDPQEGLASIRRRIAQVMAAK